MDQQTPLPPQEPVAKPLLHRAAVPVAIFAVSFLGFMLLSQRFVLPELLTMRLPDAVLTPDAVLPRRQQLTQELVTLQERRDERVSHGDILHAYVRGQADAQVDAQRLLDSALRVTREQVTEDVTIRIDAVTLDADASTLTLTGELRSSQPGTMTKLAAYADKLGDLQQVASVDASPFTRSVADNGMFVSPFIFTLHAH